MSFLWKLLAPRERRAEAFTEGFWREHFGFGGSTKSGMTMSVDRALQVTVVLACLRVIAEGVAQVPLNVMRRRKDGGADVADDHPLHWVLHHQPNSWQTSPEMVEQVIMHSALTGRFVAYRNEVRGEIRELLPYEPCEVCIDREPFRRLVYRATNDDGIAQDLGPEKVWHVKGPSWNGWDGMHILKMAREAIGLSAAAEESHALMHANGGQTSGIYSVDDKLGPDQYKALKNWVEQNMTGDNRFRPMILDRGAKFTSTTMTGVDAQHLETRKLQIEEIARAFRVFPQMIGYSDKTATFASAEAFFIAHVVHTLMPWYRRLESSINVNLLGKKAVQAGYFAKFNANALLRGSAADRAAFYQSLWNMGALNANQIRELEDMNPYEGGDTYRVQLNMADATQEMPAPQPGAGGAQAPSPAPAPKKTDAEASTLRHY